MRLHGNCSDDISVDRGATWNAGDHTSRLRQGSEPETDQAGLQDNAPAALDASKRDDGAIDQGWRNALVGYFSILEEWSKKVRRDEP